MRETGIGIGGPAPPCCSEDPEEHVMPEPGSAWLDEGGKKVPLGSSSWLREGAGRFAWATPLAAMVALVILAEPVEAERIVLDPTSPAYSYALAAGGRVEIHRGSSVSGDLRGNATVQCHGAPSIDGDVIATGSIRG